MFISVVDGLGRPGDLYNTIGEKRTILDASFLLCHIQPLVPFMNDRAANGSSLSYGGGLLC